MNVWVGALVVFVTVVVFVVLALEVIYRITWRDGKIR